MAEVGTEEKESEEEVAEWGELLIITSGVELYVNSEGAVKVESVDNLEEESDPLNFWSDQSFVSFLLPY